MSLETEATWSAQDNENLVKLIEPHTYLYNIPDPSRKNILARESTWLEISSTLRKPVEDCKKKWRMFKDGYVRNKRFGTLHKSEVEVHKKMKFLDNFISGNDTEVRVVDNVELKMEDQSTSEEKVITDNQEYYEITLVDGTPIPTEQTSSLIKIVSKNTLMEPSKKPQKRTRTIAKKKKPKSDFLEPVKILPKPMNPIIFNGPKVLQYIEDKDINKETKESMQRSQTIDKLIERVLKENTNEIDVFFRSMAASVKKLQPNLIPKVKMEVCNVVAKYEMQSFDKNVAFL